MSKQEQIIDILRLNPFISQKELAKQVGLSRPAVANYIARLTKAGIIKGRAYVLQEDTVLCLGAANIDQEAKSLEKIQSKTSNPVKITESLGGVARNYASSLKKLGVKTSLITALGDDSPGKHLLRQTISQGIEMDHSWSFPGERTGRFTAIINEVGEHILSIADMTIYEEVTPEMIDDKWPQIQSAKAVFLDTNFTREVLHHLLRRLGEEAIPLYMDAVSPIKVKKLPEDLPRIQLLSLSPRELKEEKPLKGAEDFIRRGVKNVIVLEEEKVSFINKKEEGTISFPRNFKLNTDKERNKFSAYIMYYLLKNEDLKEAIKQSLPS